MHEHRQGNALHVVDDDGDTAHFVLLRPPTWNGETLCINTIDAKGNHAVSVALRGEDLDTLRNFLGAGDGIHA